MTLRTLFATHVHEGRCTDEPLLDALAATAHDLAREDKAGRAWSRAHRYAGYTSYASLNDLPQRDPAVADLKRLLDREVAAFAKAMHFDLDRKLRLDSLWVNILKPGGTHSGHIHPHSVVSGTIYIDVPPGAGGLRFEDPRLAMMMAAPTRTKDAPTIAPVRHHRTGTRHHIIVGKLATPRVEANGAKSERISISFNYG